MDFYAKKLYAQAIESFEEKRLDCVDVKTKVFCVCNIAACEIVLGLNRKCISHCKMALDLDVCCLRAYLLHGDALMNLQKKEEAIVCWKAGIDIFSSGECIQDVVLFQELQEKHNKLTDATGTSNTSVSKPHCAKNTDEVQPAPPVAKHRVPQDLQKTQKSAPSSVKASPKLKETPSPTPSIVPSAAITIDMLTQLHTQFIGPGQNQISRLYVDAVRQRTEHMCGDNEVVDDLTALAYLQVNTGRYDIACQLFITIIQHTEHVSKTKKTGVLPHASVAVYLGLGSALAMTKNFEEAIAAFSSAIAIQPKNVDSLKRRGQTLMAFGKVVEAMEDFTTAIDLGYAPGATDVPDRYDLPLQRALAFQQIKSFRRAIPDLQKALADAPDTVDPSLPMNVNVRALIHNYIGMSQAQLGDLEDAIASYTTAQKIDPTFKEANLNVAQTTKEAGRWEDAIIAFDAALASERSLNRPIYGSVHSHLGQLYYGLGRPLKSLFHFLLALKHLPSDAESVLQSTTYCALCYHSLGCFSMAQQYYDKALMLDGDHSCWYQKQLSRCVWRDLALPVANNSIDNRMHPWIKDGWVKKSSWKHMNGALGCTFSVAGVDVSCIKAMLSNGCVTQKNIVDVKSLPATDVISNNVLNRALNVLGYDYDGFDVLIVSPDVCEIEENCGESDVSDAISAYVELASYVGKWLQLECNGFLPNNRQQTMFGLAVIEMAQCVQMSLCCAGNKEGLTSNTPPNAADPLCWRGFYDIVVKWRQISEPNDAVWWIDRFPEQAFIEGFGLQTPIVNGQLKTIRYYSYFPMAIRTLKNVFLNDLCYYNAGGMKTSVSIAKAQHIQTLNTLEDIYSVIGEDFFVITSCCSVLTADDGVGGLLKEEGTRLTLVAKAPDGFEFTIRTPGTPKRWKHFDNELSYCFDRLSVAVRAYHAAADASREPPANVMTELSDVVLDCALEMFFVWANFAPLSRGTAACGYAGLLASLYSINMTFENGLPASRQLDWEAIFTTHAQDFVARVRPWFRMKPLSLRRSVTLCSGQGQGTEGCKVSDLLSVSSVFIDYQSMIKGLADMELDL